MKNWGGKDTRQKAEAVGLGEAYLAAFGGMSHSVHGAWQDSLEYHLTSIGEGQFGPELSWHPIRPQALLITGLITVDTIARYLDFLATRCEMEDLSEKLSDLKERILRVNGAHENFLVRLQSGNSGSTP
jgi:hypothetical protein